MERHTTLPRVGARALATALVAVGALLLAGCGGGDEPDRLGAATIGADGGTVLHADGAQVVFPERALRATVTVRIAKDGSGAPPLPDIALAAGAVYAITPHGGGFDAPAQVSIPVERRTIAANEQLVLLSAEPGDTQWRVLSAARYDGEKLHAPVAHFSWFQAAVIVDRWVPTLVSSIDGKNNLGGGGIERMEPFGEISTAKSEALAQLTWPDMRLINGLTGPTQPPKACVPIRWGHDGAEWRWVRDGAETYIPEVNHPRVVRADPWPRYPSDWGERSPYFQSSPVGGYGALHYFGDENPRIYGYYDTGPYHAYNNTQIGDLYVLPPANNRFGDDLLTWRGNIRWTVFREPGLLGIDPFATTGRNPPNGQFRLDVSVMTDCGLLVEAAPLVFKLNAPLATSTEVNGSMLGEVRASDRDMLVGTTDQLVFYGTNYTDWGRTTIWYSPDPSRVAWARVPETRLTRGGTISLAFPQVTHADAGYYRADYCNRGIEGSIEPACASGPAARVRVVEQAPLITSQPASITVAQGETASFTVAADGGPRPTVQWERRESAFADWVKIPDANATTYTTAPTALSDAGSEFRAVLTNVAGRAETGAAVLTVVERYMPPRITAQPGDLEVAAGGTAVFAATAEGTGPMSYQWLHKGYPITGANTPVLTLYNVTGATAGAFELVVTNREGRASSRAAMLTVVVGTPQTQPVTIAYMPPSLAIPQDYQGTLTVSVSGTGPFSYQWMKGEEPIAGATSPAHVIMSAQPADEGQYWVQVTNVLGTVSSWRTSVHVVANDLGPPRIQAGPASLAVAAGLGATFGVWVTGAGPLDYQWRRDGVDIPGAIQSVLHLPAVSPLDAGRYSVVVANLLGSQVSAEAQLVVIGAPSITAHPAPVTVVEGGQGAFSVVAAGDGLRYQWLRDRVAIRDAVGASYTTPALTAADDGARYSVLVYNGAGVVFSHEAMVTVTAAPPPVTAWTSAAAVHAGVITYDPAVGVDASGRALAVWDAYPPGQSTSRVFFASGSVAGGWSAPAVIDGGFANGYETQIAVSPDGTAMAAWGHYAAGAYHLAAARFDGGSWGPAVRVDTSLASNSSEHLLAIDDSGRALLVWSQPTGGRYGVYASIDAGGGWSAPVAIDRGAISGVISMAVNGAGHGFVLFNETSDTVLAVPVDLGSGFGAPQVVRAKGRSVGTSRVTVDAQGNALAIWIDGTVDGDRLRWSRSIGTSGWSAPADVDAIGWPFARNLKLAGSAAGDAAAVWVLRDGDGKDAVWTRRFSPAGGWGALERLSTVGRWAETPDVAMNASGRLVVSWKQSDETNSIYQTWARVHDGVWRDAQLLASSGNDGRADAQRGLAVGPGGTAAVLWVEDAGASGEPLLGAFWP